MADNKLHGFFFTPPIEQHFIPHIMEEIFKDRVYDEFFMGKKDMVVLDAGANIGMFSYYAAPFSKVVYAMEPAQTHFDTLSHMLDHNGITNVVPLKQALSHKNGKATFYHNENVTMYSLEQAIASPKLQHEEVETISLDKLFEDHNIEFLDFLKLDVEGSECEIVGGSGFSKVADKIGVIMGEYHIWSSRNPDQFANSFKDRGFNFQWVQGQDAHVFIAKR